jgi:uncharacterized protein with GYD domain
MGKYLITVRYTAEGARGLMREGASNRVSYITSLLSGLGATVESFNFAFGDDDAYLVIDAPDDGTVAAVSLAVSSSGAVALKTTKLLTAAELDAAVAKTVDYRPPGS